MRYCNINIQDNTKRFKYIIEYKDNVEYQLSDTLSYSVDSLNDDSLRVDFFEGDSQVLRNDNYWVKEEVETTHDLIPVKYNTSSINLYFPTNSVEAFTNNNIYALTINTWIHGHVVYLGTYIIDRCDALACDREMKFMNSRYYEYVNIKFIDPWYLTYSEDWKSFRQQVCGEEEGETELNNTGSVLNFTLYPVIWSEDRYIKLDPYIGGQNAINISNSVSDYIGTDIEMQNSNEGKIVHSSIRFNQDYNTGEVQTFNDFKLYMKETYDVEGDLRLNYNLLVIDKDNIYKIVSKENLTELSCDFSSDDIAFGSWDGWKEGLRFILNVDIYIPIDSSDDDELERDDIMLLRSNTISITQDVMKYFIDNQEVTELPKIINLDSLNMKNITINAVNKIEKKIIQIDKPTDTKANLIKPVYYRVHELNNLILHPAVTENICINLDAYKSTVGTFFIRVENATFVETARNNTGIIFKIVGANLAGEVGSGTYYILNQDRELVTTGKFTYES